MLTDLTRTLAITKTWIMLCIIVTDTMNFYKILKCFWSAASLTVCTTISWLVFNCILILIELPRSEMSTPSPRKSGKMKYGILGCFFASDDENVFLCFAKENSFQSNRISSLGQVRILCCWQLMKLIKRGTSKYLADTPRWKPDWIHLSFSVLT